MEPTPKNLIMVDRYISPETIELVSRSVDNPFLKHGTNPQNLIMTNAYFSCYISPETLELASRSADNPFLKHGTNPQNLIMVDSYISPETKELASRSVDNLFLKHGTNPQKSDYGRQLY